MGTLFISFLVAIGGAVGLVVMSRTFDLETYTTRVFPLIPILYAIAYEMLEKRKTGKARPIPPSQAKEEMKAGAAAIFQNITVERIVLDVGVSFLIKFGLEVVLTAVYLAVGDQSFTDIYGTFNIQTVGRLLRGDHPWLSGSEGVLILALIALITGLGSGLWIGSTTKALPILEGVIAGAVVMYQHIEKLADETVQTFGYVTHIGFAVVVSLQVLLYGLWSGMAYRAKCERATLREEKKSARRSKK
jgi:hypothetical protein